MLVYLGRWSTEEMSILGHPVHSFESGKVALSKLQVFPRDIPRRLNAGLLAGCMGCLWSAGKLYP